MSDRQEIHKAEDRQYRDLWIAVVLQAKDDIENEPLGSVDFAQAVAFFIGAGAWINNRSAIGDYLDLHRDDLERLGRRCINARRKSEGLQPLGPGQPWPVPAREPRPATMPRHRAEAKPASARRPPRAPSHVNPFFPHGIYSTRDRAA